MARTIALTFVAPLLAAGLYSQPSFATEPNELPVNSVATVSTVVPEDMDTLSTDESFARDFDRLMNLYRDARSTGMLDEAEYIVKQIVEMSIEAYGLDSRQTAGSLVDLGSLQTANADYDAAILNLASAIAIIERIDDRLSMDLLRPLYAMGNAQIRVGNAEDAMDTWNRAVHISHVNLGPHNLEQIESLISIGQVYSDFDKQKKARKIRRRIAYLLQREERDATPVAVPEDDGNDDTAVQVDRRVDP